MKLYLKITRQILQSGRANSKLIYFKGLKHTLNQANSQNRKFKLFDKNEK